MASMQLQLAPTCAWLRVSVVGSTGWGNWPFATDESKNCIAHTKTMWGVSQPDGSVTTCSEWTAVCTCLRHENIFRFRSVSRSVGPSKKRRLAAAQGGGGGSNRLLAHARTQVPVHHQLQVPIDCVVLLRRWWLPSSFLTRLLSLRPTGVTA